LGSTVRRLARELIRFNSGHSGDDKMTFRSTPQAEVRAAADPRSTQPRSGALLRGSAAGRPAFRDDAEGSRRACEAKLLPEPLAAIEENGVFEGYASLFGVADLGKDVVAPGAFAESLARRGPAGVRMLWQHDPAEPIGRWLALEEDARGLRVRGKLNLAVARARDVHALMRQGAVDGLSIGFRVERARNERLGVRRLEKLDLWEISIVTFPMLAGARVSGVKRYTSLPGPRGGGIRPKAEPCGGLSHAIRRAADRLISGRGNGRTRSPACGRGLG
jgi:HK97 family phage prohead protease